MADIGTVLGAKPEPWVPVVANPNPEGIEQNANKASPIFGVEQIGLGFGRGNRWLTTTGSSFIFRALLLMALALSIVGIARSVGGAVQPDATSPDAPPPPALVQTD